VARCCESGRRLGSDALYPSGRRCWALEAGIKGSPGSARQPVTRLVLVMVKYPYEVVALMHGAVEIRRFNSQAKARAWAIDHGHQIVGEQLAMEEE
jgi:hypothetical protein